ncbi:MAG TPA: shikimate dehydrogenase [Bacteroidales bacterium]|nr:shikimate dehydrogenase [Bacteroidales bacterium]
MKQFGLIGYPLGHSFSKGYFAEKFKKENITDCIYDNYPIENIGLFKDIINKNTNIVGLNVTIPYKEQVIPFLNEIDIEAKEIGAVNTVKVKRNGNTVILKGFNTDVYGFETSLKPMLEKQHQKALILGTGGASKAIKFILRKLGISYISASIEELKENEIRYSDITPKLISEHLLIINATPLGTFPKVDTCPDIPYNAITSQHVLFDLVYNPDVTLFLKKGRDNGAKTKNGLQMLHLQAERAWQIWNSPEF